MLKYTQYMHGEIYEEGEAMVHMIDRREGYHAALRGMLRRMLWFC